MHSALVAEQSDTLNTLVNGQMKEAAEKRVIWKDVDEETFFRFVQYVYTGCYTEAKPGKREIQQATPNLDPIDDGINEEVDPWAAPASRPRKGKKAAFPEEEVWGVNKKTKLWAAFRDLYPLPKVRREIPTFAADDDYTDVFLCHARVYVLADCYGIPALQTLALHKLRLALTRFELHPNNYDDVIQLVQYSFNETPHKGGEADALRTLVSFFAACKLEYLWKSDDFRGLTSTLPDFPQCLITMLQNRLD